MFAAFFFPFFSFDFQRAFVGAFFRLPELRERTHASLQCGRRTRPLRAFNAGDERGRTRRDARERAVRRGKRVHNTLRCVGRLFLQNRVSTPGRPFFQYGGSMDLYMHIIARLSAIPLIWDIIP